MSELKATPGPWTVYPDVDGNFFYVAQQDGAPYTPDYSDVCGLSCQTWSGERFNVQQANAHLIAAAPELYEALEEMVERYAPGYHDCIDNGLPECEICNARAALAKARGES